MQLSMTAVYISNQKMLYNIMKQNELLLAAFGFNRDTVVDKENNVKVGDLIYDIDPIHDIGFSDEAEDLYGFWGSDPKKC